LEKQSFYQELNALLKALIQDESNQTANLANAAALLFHQMPNINWAGFYILDNKELVLGPFQGKPACTRIPWGKGVCGTAAAQQQTLVVPDVHQFPGHIACDAQSRSEIVLPLFAQGQLLGVLDVDSPLPHRFDKKDAQGLEQFVEILLSQKK